MPGGWLLLIEAAAARLRPLPVELLTAPRALRLLRLRQARI